MTRKQFYHFFSRSKDNFTTRLGINNVNLENLTAMKLLGVWIDQDLGWDTNTKQICIESYSRVQMLSKLKYAGIKREDLLQIYKLFIRSIPAYCSVAFHSSLTQKQSNKIEVIQATCLKIIIGSDYVDYDSALKLCSLSTLYQRRERRLLNFAVKCANDKFNTHMFPVNSNPHNRDVQS